VDYLWERWTTKAVRMMREMRRRSGAMIPMMIDPLVRVVFSGTIQREAQKNARLTSLLILGT